MRFYRSRRTGGQNRPPRGNIRYAVPFCSGGQQMLDTLSAVVEGGRTMGVDGGRHCRCGVRHLVPEEGRASSSGSHGGRHRQRHGRPVDRIPPEVHRHHRHFRPVHTDPSNSRETDHPSPGRRRYRGYRHRPGRQGDAGGHPLGDLPHHRPPAPRGGSGEDRTPGPRLGRLGRRRGRGPPPHHDPEHRRRRGELPQRRTRHLRHHELLPRRLPGSACASGSWWSTAPTCPRRAR